MLDHDTLGIVDKFENFSALRIPTDFNDSLADEPHRFEVGRLNAAYYKLDTIAHYFLNDLAVRV
jgi:hypothetical protein